MNAPRARFVARELGPATITVLVVALGVLWTVAREEIRVIADRHPSLHAHFIDTRADGRLAPERVLSSVDGDPRGLSVFMCGPNPMLSRFQTKLRQAGVPARRIHREHFDWR